MARMIDDPADKQGGGSEVWDGRIAPGGWVCATCGMPVESEPCALHGERPGGAA